MWPYTHDEVNWLALPQERMAAERAQRAIQQAWMAEIGVNRQPANDESAFGVLDGSPFGMRMVDARY